ncbi:GPW/gp25 family protein [Desulfogranum marinum]|uniref:GPW/gp25 family protein n=1 Tax=Desulfogranum marinum TaxID=453220 RepID=UPI0029C6ED6F|nr:GPW/gp25 family protein [Desulfogranum marinum]
MKTAKATIQSILGKGWNFPVLPDSIDKQLHYTVGPDKVLQSIWIILDTEPGERIMRPDFGCGLRRYLMKPNTSATRALIRRDAERALASWEPRVKVRQVEVTTGDDPAMVLIHIHYLHVRDGSPANLVYPFYLE